MKRFQGPNTKHELYTRFRYSPVNGIGYDPAVHRRDPSSIIKVDDTYFIWYTHCTDTKSQWLNADLHYATSKDGVNWTEHGPAVQRGPRGSWDDYSVFTCNILVAEGKYYLVYQAERMLEDRTTAEANVVGMAWANSPHGPWTKLKEPILRPSDDALVEGDFSDRRTLKVIELGSFDSSAVHDPGIVVFGGEYYLYYKGHGYIHESGSGFGTTTHPADTKWGVAIADRPEGPYVKSDFNPVMNLSLIHI